MSPGPQGLPGRSVGKGIRRDHWAGALVAFVGLGIGIQARAYKVGTLRQMGPGFFPLALAVVLVAVGILIAVSARAAEPAEHAAAAAHRPEWLGGLCIVSGMAAFILLGERAGMLPASFAAVFIAALGDRSTTIRSALGLAAVLTVFAVLVFSYGLRIQLPIVNW